MNEFELEPGEEVIRTVRKHWIVFAGRILMVIFLAYIPTLVSPLLHFFEAKGSIVSGYADFFTLNSPWVRLALGFWWLLLWTAVFNMFTNFFLNAWVITNRRIVEMRQYGFFSRKVSSFLLNHVQDITTTVSGIFAEIFTYGTVQVETAGEASQHFVMDNVAEPQDMRDLIMREIALLHAPEKPTT